MCVVNTVPAVTASTAVREGMPAATSSRIRSSPTNAAWPSFMWQTVGSLAERPQRAHPADAEDDLLADAEVVVAAVEPAR